MAGFLKPAPSRFYRDEVDQMLSRHRQPETPASAVNVGDDAFENALAIRAHGRAHRRTPSKAPVSIVSISLAERKL
jgi:hypothetical protein